MIEPKSGQAKFAVIIVTKNRAEAIKKYALSSLELQKFQDFICVVWDASDDDATQKMVESRDWRFTLEYFKAPRVGMTSQRNDAVKYILTAHTNVKFVLFIDDDSELSPDAIDGVLKTFEETDAAIVNMPVHSKPGEQVKGFKPWLLRKLGLNYNWATEFLYNYSACNSAPGVSVDWANGCGMAYRIEIFRDEKYFFPEEFQHFGGYALGEDFALSYFQRKKLGKRIVNSLEGDFIHYQTPGGRPDMARWWSARWYNFHLLFDALYDQEHGLRKAWLVIKFKLFMTAALMWHLVRGRFEALRGIREAKIALKDFYRDSNIQTLFRTKN